MASIPVISTINAFDATEGTTINFSISGTISGGNVVRSSKVYIYNSSNTLICTHIYNNTSYSHVLPANNASATTTNPAIVYESGYTYADFANNASYSMKIEIYSAVNAGGTLLGTSILKQFYCLVTPEITFTYPAQAEILDTSTSYGFVATFDPDYPASPIVTNKPQTYTFNLYESGGLLVQTSGTQYGYGDDLGATYSLSYRFAGLEDARSYYVVVISTTENGMYVESDPSPLITVDVGTISFKKADVSNECGYIRIESNVTNIVGKISDDVEYTAGDGCIDLSPATGKDKWLVWDDGYTFPVINSTSIGEARWTILMKIKNFLTSDICPDVQGETSYILQMTDGGIIKVYMRTNGVNTWAEMYCYDQTDNYNNGSFVKSNIIASSSITSSTYIAVWLRCVDGWYDIKIETYTE